MKRKITVDGCHEFSLYEVEDFVTDMRTIPQSNYFRSGASGEWAGGLGWDRAINMLQNGDAGAVAQSEKMLAEIEAFLPPPTSRHVVIDDVAGSVPNIGAYLAGQPLSMRRKERREAEASPIGIVVNLGASAAITIDMMTKRGVAILALVRAIQSVRPVELWVGAFSLANNKSVASVFRIPTAPMDLQRAAFWLANPATARVFLFAELDRMGAPGSLPFAPETLKAETFAPFMQRALPHLETVLAIPGLHISDKAISNPIAWVKEKVATISPDQMEDAA